MSTFKVSVTEIREIKPHDNADRLEIAKVYDWDVVVRKDEYKVGDIIIYVPVDSILPQELEDKIFGSDSKIKLHKHRVKSIRIRGHISQGMIINLNHVKDDIYIDRDDLEKDMSSFLNISKYEPPAEDMPTLMRVAKKKKAGNPNFKKYTDIENFKYYDRTFQDGEQVYVSEKLHGTSFRCGWFKTEANTLLKKVKKFFGLLPEWEFCYGSRTVEISAKVMWNGGYYGEDVYGQMVQLYDLKNRIPKGFAVYGEIVGDGIQKGYNYGCKKGERMLYVYDIMDTNQMRWLDYPQFRRGISDLGLPSVPTLYVGPYSKEVLDQHRDGDSKIGGQKVREGIVVKPVVERSTGSLSRVVLKYISDAYYLKQASDEESTEFH
jgi:RNA ligase (TIGR02306 family)